MLWEGQVLLRQQISVDEASDCLQGINRLAASKLIKLINRFNVPLIVAGKGDLIDNALFGDVQGLEALCFSETCTVFEVKLAHMACFAPNLPRYLREVYSHRHYDRSRRMSRIVQGITQYALERLTCGEKLVDELTGSERHVLEVKKHAYNVDGVDLAVIQKELGRLGAIKKYLTEGIFAKFSLEKIQEKIDEENLPKTDPFDTGNIFKRVRSSLAAKKKGDDAVIAARKASGIRIRGCELLKRAPSLAN